MIILTLETRNFEFLVASDTEAHALNRMRSACKRHCDATGADYDYFADLLTNSDNCRILDVNLGDAFRDGSPI